MATAAQGKAAVGTIKVSVGDVKVIGVDGVARNALVGERVFAKEIIQTSANGLVQIQLENGRFIDLGRDSRLALDENVTAGGAPATAGAPAGQDIAAIQAQIAAGADPSKVAEATAAGGAAPGAGGADGGGGTPLIIEQANSIGPVTSGFNTGPASIAFPEIQPELLPVIEGEPVINVTVAVNVDIGIGIGGENGGGGLTVLPPGTVVPAAGVTAIDIVEGTGGAPRPVSFLITLSAPAETDVTITYTIVPVNAANPEDFFNGPMTGTVTIPAGSPGFIVTELIVEDADPEGNESFQIVLSNPIGATLLNDTATVTIVDDDVTLAAANVAGDETGSLVTLSGALIPDYGPGDTGTITLSASGATWSAATNTLSANNGSWTIVVNGNGTYTFNQLAAFTHPDTNDADEPLSFTVSAVAQDSAGNSASTSFTVTVDDAGPVANDDGLLASVDDNAAGVKIGTVAQLLGNDNYDTDGAAASGSIVIATGDKGGTISIVNGDLLYTSAFNVSEESEIETFTYAIKDADGDTDTATFTVELTDGGPFIGTQAPIEVDEEGLEGGNKDPGQVATGDLAGAAVTKSGNFAGLDFGQDGPGDITLAAASDTGLRTLSGNVVRTEWDQSTHTLTGLADTGEGDEVVFTLVIDDVATGHYVFTLLLPVQHALQGADVVEDDKSFSVDITVTDNEGDPAFGSISIVIDDDSPIAVLQASGEDSATLDDSNFTSVTLFSNDGQPTLVDASQYGADGFGSRSFSLTLSEEGVDSGLDHISGANILLFTEGGDIVGRAGSSGGVEVLRFSVDTNTGEVTVSQSAAIKHDDPNDSDEAIVAEGTVAQKIASGLITLTMDITDADNDADSDNIEVGSLVNFLDDGPSVSISANVSGSVLTDETSQLGATVTGTSSAVVIATATTGNDGGTTDVSLVVTQANTGYFTTVGNHAITLVVDANDNNVVHGMYNGTNIAFTVSISNSGVLSVTQFVAMKHPISPDNYDEGITLDGMLSARVEVTDGDGDKAGQTVAIGNQVTFEDDGPTLTVTGTAGQIAGLALNVDETVGATDRANAPEVADGNGDDGAGFLGQRTTAVSGGLTTLFTLGGNAGSDGQASQTGTLSLVFSQAGPLATNLTATAGGAIQLVLTAGGVVEGRDTSDNSLVFQVELVGGAGAEQLRLTQYEAINHDAAPGANETPDLYDEVVSLLTAAGAVQLQHSVTRTDNDGDAITVANTINLANTQSTYFSFDDDGPLAFLSTDLSTSAVVQETGGVATLTFNLSGTQNFGADGAAATGAQVYSLQLVAGNGVDSGLKTSIGQQTIYLYQTSATTIVGSTDGPGTFVAGTSPVSLTFTLNAGSTTTITVASQGIFHPLSDVDQILYVATPINAVYTVTDGDGDTAQATVSLSEAVGIADGAPILGVLADLYLANQGNVVASGTLNLSGSLADGVSDINVTPPLLPPDWTSTSVDTTSGGQFVSTTTTIFNADGDPYGTFTVNADGTYSFTLITPTPITFVTASLQGLTPGGPTDPVNLAVLLPNGDTYVNAVFTSPGADAINSSTQGMGVNNNLIDSTETIVINFDEDLTDIGFTVGNLRNTGGSQIETLTWQVWNNGVMVDSGTFTPPPGTGESDDVSLVFSEQAGWDGDIFDEVRVSAQAGDEYRLLTMSVQTTQPPPAVQLDFGVQVVDGDGDVTATQPVSAIVSGGVSPFTLTGTDAADIIVGGSGNDTLSGAGGNDILTGGAGNDLLIGGSGSDTFKFTGAVSAANADAVQGFTVGLGGDVLDLHDVLPAAAQGATTEGALSAYVIVDTSTSPGNTLIKVDTNGATGGTADAVTVATLEGVTGATLAQLLANNQIVT